MSNLIFCETTAAIVWHVRDKDDPSKVTLCGKPYGWDRSSEIKPSKSYLAECKAVGNPVRVCKDCEKLLEGLE